MDNKNRNNIEFETGSEWIVYFRLFIYNIKLSIEIFLYLIKQLFYGMWITIPEKDIRGQVAMITGSSNGLGRALSIEFAKRQCHLALVDMDEKNGKELEEFIRNSYKIKVKFYKADISIYENVEKLKSDIERDIGHIDILINNAGIMQSVQTLNPKRTPNEISKLIDVNLKASIWAVKIFLPGMIERKRGHIIATCSLTSLLSSAFLLDYSASKQGLKGFMDSLYFELLVKGYSDIIKTSMICPTLVLTSDSVIKTIKGTKVYHNIYPWSPERAAKTAIKAVLKNERLIVLPSVYKLSMIFNLIPDDAKTKTLKRLLNVDPSGFEE
ncbi:retinol dehydrogenase 10-A-like [Condylostylus longicornis]|uniref:retinol dehydrogenase 10-A-like n=1 Tax=Condylostylus longicornis TaxID=2530218 RepID=UPI00244DAB13|nr:retinol dehydrogenase 10-A-like [Condylostylus longicornis]